MSTPQDAAVRRTPQLQNLVAEVGLPPHGMLVEFQLAGEYGARFLGRRGITPLGDMIDCGEYGDMASSLMTSWKPVRDCT